MNIHDQFRHPNESFDEYKIRRSMANKTNKEHLRGKLVISSMLASVNQRKKNIEAKHAK